MGYSFAAYDITALATPPDFTAVDVFLVDNSAGMSSWDATNSAVLTGTGKPIIGIGEGTEVFESLDQFLDRGQGWGASGDDSITPMDISHPLFTTPYDLGLTNQDDIQITLAASEDQAVYDDGTAPADVEFLGREQGQTAHYAIVVQGVKYAEFGFSSVGPSGFTATGRHVFVNLIEYTRTAR